MTQVVNVCHGWGCPLMTKCAVSDFNAVPRLPGTWTRHYMSPYTGEYCADFAPLAIHDGPSARIKNSTA